MAVKAFPLPGTTGVVGPLFQTAAVQGKAAEKQYFRLLGWTMVETVGTAKVTATFTDSTGTVVGVAQAPAGQSTPPAWFGPEGVVVQGQLTVTYSGTGTPSGDVYIR